MIRRKSAPGVIQKMMPREADSDPLAWFEQRLSDRTQKLRAMKISQSLLFVVKVTAPRGAVTFAAGAAVTVFIGQGG